MPAPGRHFDNWIKTYMEFSGESEAPDKFHYWTAVAVIAGCLRRRVWLSMGYFDWTPNFYIIFVAPPGIVSKSTTANIGMSLLREVKDIKFGPDVVTWQALSQSLAQSTEMVPQTQPDGTILYIPMSALTIVSGELGNFFNPNDREMVDLLVALWDGQKGVFTKTTKTQGNDAIENPWVNLIGCTTPAWIAGNFPEYLIGGGFTSRCIFVYADHKRHLNAYPFRNLPANFAQIRQALIDDLGLISSFVGEYTLTPDAITWGEQWYQDHYDKAKQKAYLDTARFGGYLARKQTHIHKLAMVTAAAQRNDLNVEKEDLETSANIVDSIEADMPKVFSNIGRTSASLAIMEVVETIKGYGKVDQQTFFRSAIRTLGKKEVEEAVGAAISAGLVEIVQQNNTVYLNYKGP